MKPLPLFVGACLLAAVLPWFALQAHAGAQPDHAVRPDFEATLRVAAEALAGTHLRGRPLTQQAPSALEARFAERFPGTLARLRAGDATVLVRSVALPTRQLHPAADCFRAAGYRVGPARAAEDARAARWRCFPASRGGEHVRVCERFADAAGNAWTDVSSWYWSALWAQRGGAAGPWWAITIVTPLQPEEQT